MKDKLKFKEGDVVVVNRPDTSKYYYELIGYEYQIGVIKHHADSDDTGVKVEVETLAPRNYHNLWFHPTSLIKIGTL